MVFHLYISLVMVHNWYFICFTELKISIDRSHPALSSHQVTVKLGNAEPLVIQVPWPVPVQGASYSVSKKKNKSKNKSVKLLLEKTFTEPWPYELGGRSKWDPDRLIRWKEIEGNGTIKGLSNISRRIHIAH